MSRFVYADHAATTSVAPEVLNEMLPYFGPAYGNPSSLYSLGRQSADAIANARARIAAVLGAKPTEIFFTSCGSEADNWAIKGVAKAKAAQGKHIITTVFEHHAVLHTMHALEKDGYEVTYLSVDSEGLIKPEELEAAIRPDTILVAMMYANNEIGTILPIKEMAEVAHAHKITFFTDAVQAVGNIPVHVNELGVDLLSLSGHKLHAPKGIGVLYVRTGTRIANLIDGGGQERHRRGGTENVAYICGLAKALEMAVAKLPEMTHVKAMRDRLANEILKIPHTRINGSMEHRLAGNLNVSFEFIEGESLLLLLDMQGICASTGSACSTASLEPSHVLLSIGLPAEKAHGSLRISLSHENTEEDVDYILEKLPPIVARLREMSPLYDGQS
ncbi:MAG: cysteine desulfurase NifS [Ruminococcaceae bacterium]|nr:cysteine desulfurase NifS [Oscillospiraceae bacterium]